MTAKRKERKGSLVCISMLVLSCRLGFARIEKIVMLVEYKRISWITRFILYNLETA